MHNHPAGSVSARLHAVISQAIDEAGGWIPFDRYMALALYQPGLGYYARADRPFGRLPRSGSDFVTAPELSPWFTRALARPVAQALEACGAYEVLEFGAGSGALAMALIDALDELGAPLCRYSIVDVSGSLRASQRERLARHGDRVRWLDELPPTIDGVVIGNEVLDAMPVQLLHRLHTGWHERGVSLLHGDFVFADCPTDLRPPISGDDWPPGSTLELHAQACAFVATLAERMRRAVAWLIDYGFPQAEYYHPQRWQGTLVCHRAHRVDDDPLSDIGLKDITAHVDFTAIALAAQDAGADVIGYTSQARFLLNCGFTDLLGRASIPERADALKLINEHEMGELFKVIAFARGLGEDFALQAIGFAEGDRSHTL